MAQCCALHGEPLLCLVFFENNILYLLKMESIELKNISLKEWTLNTIYGWLIGFVCVILLAFIFEALGVGNSQFFVGTGMAAGVGLMQNRLLRNKSRWDWNWMWATIIGMTLAFVILEFGSALIEIIPEFNLQI